MDKSHCIGCTDDFYNGNNPLGVKECWLLAKAELAPRILIPIDLAPPYKHLKVEQLPKCYKKQRYDSVSPDRLDTRGYWK